MKHQVSLDKRGAYCVLKVANGILAQYQLGMKYTEEGVFDSDGKAVSRKPLVRWKTFHQKVQRPSLPGAFQLELFFRADIHTARLSSSQAGVGMFRTSSCHPRTARSSKV